MPIEIPRHGRGIGHIRIFFLGEARSRWHAITGEQLNPSYGRGPSCRIEAVHDNKQPHSLIQDAKDPRFQHLCSLQSPRARSRSGLYLIEGVRHVARAAEERASIQSVFITPSVLSNPFGKKLVRKFRQAGVPCVQLAPQLYRDLTLAAEPQGIGAVVRQQWCSLN